MNKGQYEQVVNIMQSVMKEPYALPFLNPIDTDDPESHKILKKIDQPMDLTTINNKLTNNKYKSIKKWKSDMDLIYQNTLAVYGKENYITSLAEALKDEYEKLMNESSEDPIKDWLNETGNTSQKIVYLMSNKPQEFLDYWKHQFGDLTFPKMNKSDIAKIIEKSQRFTSERDAQAMFSIIHGFNPTIKAYSESVQLDLQNVSNRTHWALEWFLRKKCEDSKIGY